MSKVCEVYLSLSSPFSYLAFSQLKKLEERTGCQVDLFLVDLAKVWELNGNPGPIEVGPKLNYLIKDVGDWCKLYQLPLNMPSRFPMVNRPSAAASLIARKEGKLREFIERGFEAYWLDDLDIGDAEVLGTIGADVGLDAAEVTAAVTSDTVLAAVDAEAKSAAGKGVFGVPSFWVEDDLYWGNDRLMFVEDALNE